MRYALITGADRGVGLALAEAVILLTYAHEGQDWPAAWVRHYGLGRVVFLMPGHHLPSFGHEAYGRWIVNAAKWTAGRL